MAEFPIIEKKRFWPFRLNSLVNLNSHQVNKWSEETEDDEEIVAGSVIKIVEYPMHHGAPDDTHIWNAYHGDYKRCYRRDKDFWQLASETAYVKVGDCEDSSIVCTALEGKLVNANQTYEVLGMVKDADTGRNIGGHGWNYTRWNGEWHYVETTRDTPPEEYPVVENIREPYVHGDWKLVPYVLFNWKRYEELKGGLTAYMDLDFEQKETRQKYEALAELNEARMKPLEQAGILSKLRRW